MSAPEGASAADHRPRRLRTVLCTRGGLFGALVLRELRTCDRVEVCGIVRSSRMFHPTFGILRGALAYVRRSGIAYALYMWCATTLADVLCGLARIGRVPMRTRPRAVPVHTTTDVNGPDGLLFLRDCAPDLLVSAFFDQRLHDTTLAVPAVGCVNIHPSLLPWFKGVDPVLQARLNAAPAGVSVHYMTPELDAGTILAQRSVATLPGQTIFEATAQLFRAGAELLVGALDRVAKREAGAPQSAPGSYQSWPTRDDICALRAREDALIRWSDMMAIFSA